MKFPIAVLVVLLKFGLASAAEPTNVFQTVPHGAYTGNSYRAIDSLTVRHLYVSGLVDGLLGSVYSLRMSTSLSRYINALLNSKVRRQWQLWKATFLSIRGMALGHAYPRL